MSHFVNCLSVAVGAGHPEPGFFLSDIIILMQVLFVGPVLKGALDPWNICSEIYTPGKWY